MPDKLTIAAISNALVIDDSSSILQFFTILLEGLGVLNVFNAINGKKALQILDHTPDIELILCDLNMPEMDGIEVIRHLSARNYQGKIVLISGEHKRVIDSTARLAQAYNLNILGTLEKPVSMGQLHQLLNNNTNPAEEGKQTVLHEFNIDDMRSALHNHQFIIYVQPKIDLHSQKVIGGEALARWQHPQLGLVGADAFIPFLEQHNLIQQLTDSLLEQAMGFTREMCQHESDFKLSVNVSVDSLEHLELPDRLLARCNEFGIQPTNLIFELTESHLYKDYKKAMEIMARLRLKGFGLSIDDFGTGYSSMEQLQNFPFDELKIDKTFITGASTRESSRAIIQSSVDIASKLDMQVVAEGVETSEDWRCVAEMGCDIIQGYMLARPMPTADFIEYIKNKSYQTELPAPQAN